MDFETRKTLWLALSELYLDTEISESTLYSIEKAAKKNDVSFETLFKINKEEVFPVLFKNGLSVAGVWTGFDESWLIETISKSLKKNNCIKKKYNSLKYMLFSTLISTSMKRLELLFNENKKI
tara:strand:- start:19891 stop:20259 length:369 start_codon:yes stop_codon:yes gene_type:complete